MNLLRQQKQRLITSTLVSLFTVISLAAIILTSPILLHLYLQESITRSPFVESKFHALSLSSPTSPSQPPRLAYHISGSAGDANALKRTLMAVYHPRNRYVVHLDRGSEEEERVRLKEYIESHALFRRFGNVRWIERANLVTYRGPTMVSNTIHGAAVALREWRDWDWFINLSASDYPLVTQDDLLHVFSKLPRDLNFMEHTSDLGWKDYRAKPILIDPGLYLTKKYDVFSASQTRSIPTAFKLFTGSFWTVQSRSFVEYLIWGWDNLPRTLLMYFTNFVSSSEEYFQTVICNAEEFMNTTVNSDLHFISWDNPPMQHPRYLTLADLPSMVASNAAFARKIRRDDPLLDKIDEELLSRGDDDHGWCIWSRRENNNGTHPCSAIGDDPTFLRPGPGSQRLQSLINSLLSDENFRPNQCV